LSVVVVVYKHDVIKIIVVDVEVVVGNYIILFVCHFFKYPCSLIDKLAMV